MSQISKMSSIVVVVVVDYILLLVYVIKIVSTQKCTQIFLNLCTAAVQLKPDTWKTQKEMAWRAKHSFILRMVEEKGGIFPAVNK